MKVFIYLFIINIFLINGFVLNRKKRFCHNNRPIIGVLTQEVTGLLEQNYGKHCSYVAASYVKHLESAGARVVPIWIGADESYYRNILSLINGVLLPGGASEFNVTNGYAAAGWYIMSIADEFNKNGDYFPIWGTCLGFELITYLSNNNNDLREDCKSSNEALPIKFKPDFGNSRLFRLIPSEIVEILCKQNSTINFHQYCITEKLLYKYDLFKIWKVLSTNFDECGLEFVSSIEHNIYPYFGVQFHPEKPAYEWNPKHNTPHTRDVIKANQYFMEFFVDETRKNCHTFTSEEQERENLIYNFPTTYGLPQSTFTQIYFFD
ncbi:gamma-glutamyl hydrolase precursor, putative [Pediculus humanus corporis]|uniref:folate gamma-glutamyl hydrolase n=1 Tax=Pediculus humanus subsp. corporis TaxID=121224 RepID=E0VGS7_PEDHC|nr:gamma-glutamyl hydrolase precursor, putative [Pediculus humanus corporis]EEB12583.1 gamma-glutamyl hydrolase precursor, putative [Pediculus humanus corporis]